MIRVERRWFGRTVALAAAMTLVASVAHAQGGALTWDALVARAKQEGSVRVALPNGMPGLVPVFAEAFNKEYGIKLNATNDSSTVPTVVEREAAAGKPSIDVIISGASELLSLYPKNLLAPIAPILVKPDVADGSKWRGGKIGWIDSAQRFMPLASEWIHLDLVVNADKVDPKSITSWKDLLKPEFNGKIIAQSPFVGAGGATARQVLEDFGDDYVSALYKNAKISRDAREVARSIALGTHPIGIALLPVHMETFRKEGFKLERVFPKDGIHSSSGGSGNPKLIANSPNPNAAAVFINWFMSKEGQELYAKVSLEPSRRTDVVTPEVPDYIRPWADYKYRDQYAEDYYAKIGPRMREKLDTLLGR